MALILLIVDTGYEQHELASMVDDYLDYLGDRGRCTLSATMHDGVEEEHDESSFEVAHGSQRYYDGTSAAEVLAEVNAPRTVEEPDVVEEEPQNSEESQG